MENALNPEKNTVLLVCLDESQSKESISIRKDLEILGASFGEVHIAVFSQKPSLSVETIEHPQSNIWVYAVSHFPLLRYFSFSFFVRRHLLWRNNFRPTHILSYGSGMTSHLASSLTKKYHIPLTLKIGIHDAVNEGLSLILLGARRMYKRATRLIVEGGERAKTLKKYKEKIVLMTPFFDFQQMLASPIEPVFFNRKYEKDFFFISHFEDYDDDAIDAVCKIMRILSKKYIKGGHIIFVPYADMKRTARKIRSYGLSKSVFVEPERADMLPVYKGARLYIHTRKFDEFSVPVLFSLTLGIPTVTTPTGYVEDMYQGSSFERFVLSQSDIDGFCARISELVEKDYLFNDYKMNTPVLMNKFPHESRDTYIQKIAQVILG